MPLSRLLSFLLGTVVLSPVAISSVNALKQASFISTNEFDLVWQHKKSVNALKQASFISTGNKL